MPAAWACRSASFSLLRPGRIHRTTTLPILLDVGTDDQERLHDAIYMAGATSACAGRSTTTLSRDFVAAVIERWPHVLLEWEDFAGTKADPAAGALPRSALYFNDDIQGTAAVASATLLAAINVTGKPLKEQRIAMLASARRRGYRLLDGHGDGGSRPEPERGARPVYAVDKDGLLVEGYPDLHPTQQPFVKKREIVAG